MWGRRVCSVLAAAALALCSGGAHADGGAVGVGTKSSESTPSSCTPHSYCHDGLYLRAIAGLAYASLVGHDAKGDAASISDIPVSTLVAVGGTPVRGLVIGGELGAMTGTMTNGQVALFVQWYPAPRRGWHAGLDLGAAFTSTPFRGGAAITGSVVAASSTTYTTAYGYGAIATLQGGYDWWIAPRWSMGLNLFASSGTTETMLDSKGNDTGYRFVPLQGGLGLSVVIQ